MNHAASLTTGRAQSPAAFLSWAFVGIYTLLAGVTIVAYDGSATYPDTGALWRMAEQTGVTYFGTGAPYSGNGEFRLAGSGLGTTGGDAMIVGGGALTEPVSSIREVPSLVQKLSHSSANVSLQLGQRFI